MASADTVEEKPTPKRRLGAVVVGLVSFFVLAAGGFFAGYSGLTSSLILGDGKETAAPKKAEKRSLPSFVSLDPMVVTLVGSAANTHLRIKAQLEVAPDAASDVAHMAPRILDVLNGYLRALHPSDIEARDALLRLRAQMLRRIQVVVGEDRVRDLLITEFVLN